MVDTYFVCAGKHTLPEEKKITSFGQSSLVAEPQQPCQMSFIYDNLNVSDLQIETPKTMCPSLGLGLAKASLF